MLKLVQLEGFPAIRFKRKIIINGHKLQECVLKNGCGLKWKSVLFDNNKIIVENAFKDTTIYDEHMKIIGHRYEDGELKTKESYRTIHISKRLKTILQTLQEKQMQLFEILGKKWTDSEYVFLNTEHKPFVPERLTEKIQGFIKKYKLEHMTVYGFRH